MNSQPAYTHTHKYRLHAAPAAWGLTSVQTAWADGGACPCCPCRSTLVLGGILSQTELLTFILFWTLANNIVYMF